MEKWGIKIFSCFQNFKWKFLTVFELFWGLFFSIFYLWAPSSLRSRESIKIIKIFLNIFSRKLRLKSLPKAWDSNLVKFWVRVLRDLSLFTLPYNFLYHSEAHSTRPRKVWGHNVMGIHRRSYAIKLLMNFFIKLISHSHDIRHLYDLWNPIWV